MSRKGWAICLGLVVAVALLYGRVGRFEFQSFDDKEYVLENKAVLGGLTWSGAAWAFRSGHAGNWHPLAWISHMADVSMFALRPGGHHGTSVVLHAANAVLLFLALRRMTRALWPSAFVAGLFAVHPLRVESVAWVAERKDVLSGLFFMLTLLAYAAYAEKPGAARHAAVLASFTLGILAKPMLVTVPCVLLLLDVWPLARWRGPGLRPNAGLLLEKLPLLLVSAASSVVTYIVQSAGEAVASFRVFPLEERLANALVAYGAYLRKTVWPSDLSFFYPHPSASSSLVPAAGSLVLLAGLTSVALLRFRRAPYLAVGWLWFLGMLVPVIGIVQVGMQAMADRYAYLPTIGLYVAVAWAAADLVAARPSRRTIVVSAAALAIGAAMIVTSLQVPVWRNGPTLYEHALKLDPGNYVALNNLAVLLDRQGRHADAERDLSRALAVEPAYFDARSNLGTVLTGEGRLAEAAEQYRRAVALRPSSAGAHYNLGVALERSGALAEAEAAYRRSLELDLGNPDAHYNLALVLEKKGDVAGAIAEYRSVLRIQPAADATEALRRLERPR